jgi:hypothetical protein
MNRNWTIFAALIIFVAAWAVYAAQDTTFSQREVRDPRKLEAILEANASDAQSRLATLETTMPSATLISNATLKVYASNLVVKAGGTVEMPAASLDAAALSGNIAGARLTNAVGVTVQAYDADLDTWATVTPSANGKTLVAGTFGTMRTNLTLVVGTDVQAYDADLDDLADGSLTASKVASGYAAAGLTGNVPLAALTNALSETLYSGTVTNNPTVTNVFVILNGVVVSVTQL